MLHHAHRKLYDGSLFRSKAPVMDLEDLERIAREQLWPPGYALHDCRDARQDVYIFQPFYVITPTGPMKTARCRDAFLCDMFSKPEDARVAAWAHYDEARARVP